MTVLVALLLAAAQEQTITKAGTSATQAQAIQGLTNGVPVPVSGSLSVAGTADLAGNTATYNANNVCSSVITAGEQSVGFHLTAGTLDATLTPYITNQTGAINCATAGTCTASAFSSGGTIVVTNPNGVKDVGVNLVGGVRQVQVCTTTFNSGSASGVVTATFVQAASSGGGGGGSVTQGTDPWLVAGKGTAGSPSGGVVTVQGAASMTAVKTDGSGVTQPVSGTVAATQSGTWTVQPGNTANTTAWKVDGSAVTQPVSGTVTTTPPANASTNVAQVAGTATDTNSGVKSAGTLRVVLATDQPALTNKLLVTPDSVALPANQSVNVAQVAGATTATGHGTAAGSLRVELPTDGTGLVGAAQSGTWTVQPGNTANTTAWKVDGSAVTQPVSGTVTANQGGAPWAQNITQIAGTTILTGNGVTGAGSPRVTIASDNTAFTVNAAQSGTWNVGQSGSWTVDISDRAARLLGVVYGSQGQQLKQTATNFNLQAELAVGGTLIDPRAIRALTSGDTVTVVQGTGTNLHMVCDSGCTPGGSFADGSAFTENSTAINVSGGVYNEAFADLDPGEAGAPRVTAKRAMHVNLRDRAGLELTKGPNQPATSSDPSVVVQFSPNSPVTFNALVPPKVQIAGTTKVQVADEHGHVANVKGPWQAPTTVDPAQVVALSPIPAPICSYNAAVSQTTSTIVIPNLPSKTIYICKVFIVSATAQSLAITEGTGSACATGAAALAGSTTVANGMALAVNGGWVEGNGGAVVYTAKKAGDDICVLQSGAGNVSGSISYTYF